MRPARKTGAENMGVTRGRRANDDGGRATRPAEAVWGADGASRLSGELVGTDGRVDG